MIEELRGQIGAGEVHVVEERLVPGEAVEIESGVLQGLGAVVTRVLPARERVRVLLELLGREANVELPRSVLRSARDVREGLFREGAGKGRLSCSLSFKVLFHRSYSQVLAHWRAARS